ncbi:META domain-containing protein [Adhaeribacter sp. BT258]|uniref:META domain-containing protein n=1 Tax=Adhaeribacter terrigena TaxID=2793070 RepID=A0ABS1C5K1_9BACT|nr:META domain-containing protein [Adhaeribacter terrigena]MBK0404667.1 META domain-containing protein [Adhaeribacter terrigena]
MKKHLFLASFFALTLSGCNATKNADLASKKGATQITKEAQQASTIMEKRWKLVELEGQHVIMTSDQQTEAHFVLHTAGNKVTGNGGCNTINGTYSLSEGNRIRFSKMAVTMMYCQNMEMEGQFLKVFEIADNYSLHGDTLTLNVGRRASLAVFHAVYLH